MEIIKGYKATDQDMCCNGFKFELGKWYEHNGAVELCKSGFHFCMSPSGPWSFYPNGRLFKCEAIDAQLSIGPGSDLKHVAKKIRLVEEVAVDGYGNTGNLNTGNRNTGNWNTGNWNTGDGNTGNWNTGYWNTGYGNTGNGSTGNGNTGNGNTGNGNTGYGNTGNGNTGYGNCGSFHSGDLNCGDAEYFIFNKKAKRSDVDINLIIELSLLLQKDEDIDPVPFLSLPNATPEAIKNLHDAHKKARKEQK